MTIDTTTPAIPLSEVASVIHRYTTEGYDTALIAATTLAAQLDYQVAAGGQSPDRLVSREDAAMIAIVAIGITVAGEWIDPGMLRAVVDETPSGPQLRLTSDPA